MPVSFEDLVPTAQQSNESALLFEDLVPQTDQSDFREVLRTLGGAGLNAIPIAGPAIYGGAQRLAALKRAALDENVDYGQALEQIQAEDPAVQERHPYAKLAGALTGGVAGTLPMIAAAPAAFGAGTGSLAARTAASAGSTAALGVGDAYVRGEDAGRAGLEGAAIGAALPLAGAAVRGVLGSNPITPARQAIANTLLREGVQPSAGQVTGRRSLRFWESQLGGEAAQNVTQEANEQLTNAYMRRAGGTGLATQDNMAALRTRLGGTYDAIATRNTLQMDRQAVQDVINTYQGYERNVATADLVPAVRDFVDDIGRAINTSGGRIPGDVYRNWRSSLGQRARAASRPEVGQAYYGLQRALDQAMERSMIASGNAADAQLMRETNRQYRNFLVLERASARAGGEEAGRGVLSPARIRDAAVNIYGEAAYAEGRDPFSHLTRAAQNMLTPLPNSGTASRLAPYAAAGTLAAGATQSVNTSQLWPALAATAAVAAPPLAGRALMSGPVQRGLINQATQPAGPQVNPLGRAALMQLLMGLPHQE